MAVAIRLSRQGSKKRPFYRVVAAEKSAPRDGRFIEQIGIYDPRTKLLRIDCDRYARWLQSGALPSATVMSLAKRAAAAEPPAATATATPTAKQA